MFNIILFEPEIPPNTGNIIRLCANTNCHLHLIKPLGFEFNNKQLKRAGLDYHDLTRVTIHESFADCINTVPLTIYALSTKGSTFHHQPAFQRQDCFLFGPETRGLPPHILAQIPPERILKIPHHTLSRSLNLSNAVAIMIYEAWRQQGFATS